MNLAYFRILISRGFVIRGGVGENCQVDKVLRYLQGVVCPQVSV
jgi:hypothetical protein